MSRLGLATAAAMSVGPYACLVPVVAMIGIAPAECGPLPDTIRQLHQVDVVVGRLAD